MLSRTQKRNRRRNNKKTRKARQNSKKNSKNINKPINQQIGGALSTDDLISIIELELDAKLDDTTKTYYTDRYERFNSAFEKEAEFTKIIAEIQHQIQMEHRHSNTSPAAAARATLPVPQRHITRISRYSRNSGNGSAAAARVVQEPGAMIVFTIITTGLSNWGSENNVIKFYGIIMESLIMNTFFGKVARIQVHHYDSNLLKKQIDLIKTTETQIEILRIYKIHLASNIYNKDLEPREPSLQSISESDIRYCFHLDFANLDAELQEPLDSFLSIQGQPIRKMYFGYWESNYPDEYANIIKQIKLLEINPDPDKSITTVADKMRDIGIARPSLFYPIPECEGVPRQVITIPGIRTMYQWDGINAIELYDKLWRLPHDYMRVWLDGIHKKLIDNAFVKLESVRTNQTPLEYCEFCQVRQCLTTKFLLNEFRQHPRLCSICFKLTRNTIEKEIIKNTPHTDI